MRIVRNRTVSTLLAATILASATILTAQADDDTDKLMTRAAQGDLSQPGGARRLDGDITTSFRNVIVDGRPKNVILLIGDGMGDSEITVARNYALGAGQFFKGIDALPVTGQYTHYSLDKKTGKPTYVTDSAASGTAWATGVKSYNGAIGVDIREQPHQTLLEMAKAAGLGTGNVSTAELQDATPAVQIAHVTGRKCYAPSSTTEKCPTNALENGGLGSITEQLINARADVTLGGGAKSFSEAAKAGEWKDKSLMDQAKARGYKIVTSLDEMQAVTAAGDSAPLLGLFSDGNMPVRWQGPKASHHGNTDKEVVTCQVNEKRNASVPTLSQMTTKAIDLLKGNDKGFFLQVEGASIDKQDHAANPCGQIGETVDLDEAVQEALKFAKADGHTLVIVTADHAHASQIIDAEAKAPGLSEALMTKDGAVMAVTYGNSDDVDDQGHTGTQLRVAAFGPRAANVTGLTDQTDMFYTISDALGLKAQKAAMK
ncbi:MAG: alkaline phosphatase [Neorhizobium sp.]|nr:alkaline phosphatase [Neorhizobium sp.]